MKRKHVPFNYKVPGGHVIDGLQFSDEQIKEVGGIVPLLERVHWLKKHNITEDEQLRRKNLNRYLPKKGKLPV